MLSLARIFSGCWALLLDSTWFGPASSSHRTPPPISSCPDTEQTHPEPWKEIHDTWGSKKQTVRSQVPVILTFHSKDSSHKSWVSSIPKPLVTKQNVCTHPQQELIAWSKLLKSCIVSASARHRPGAGRQHHCPFKQHVTYIWRLCKGATASSNQWAYVEELCHRNKSYHFRSHNKQLQLWTSPRCLLNYYLGQAEVHLVKIELPFFERRRKCFSLHCSYHCWGNQAGICFQ